MIKKEEMLKLFWLVIRNGKEKGNTTTKTFAYKNFVVRTVKIKEEEFSVKIHEDENLVFDGVIGRKVANAHHWTIFNSKKIKNK